MPNNELVDIFVAVDDVLKRIDATTLATLSPDDYEAGRRSYAALCKGAAKPVAKRRERKPTLAGVAKQVSRAGIEVARYEVKPDGTVVVVTGKTDTEQTNDLDNWIAKHADTGQRH
jgi:hypothetical protein